MMSQDNRRHVVPASYQPLLTVIAAAESHGNYNAYFGNAANTSIRFTDMTVAEVLAWQKQHVAQGGISSAVGRYQIIDTTLGELVHTLGIDHGQRFDEATQDAIAIGLLERRGSVAYANNQMTREEFAANLAKEWASLPSITGASADQSYYAGDGINKSLVAKEKVLGAIDKIETVE